MGRAAQPARAVRPRDAASVVLLREAGTTVEVLMGRRRKRARFLPDIYVFPGGRVDAADRCVPGDRFRLSGETELALRRDTPNASPSALALAAIRETHEETGYLLGRAASGDMLNPLPSTPFWNACREACMVPDMAALDYIMRALTPTLSPRRFNTRFFLADGAGCRGDLLVDGELEDLHWLPLDDAFDLPIIDVTELALTTARQRWQGRALGQRPATIPFVHYVRDTQRIDHV
ncbi:MAG: NUDIX hydrolase [Alphaproteobacteria bacterium]|nr:NUDIX hydrolase [Alphaproteobacteria bacterium]